MKKKGRFREKYKKVNGVIIQLKVCKVAILIIYDTQISPCDDVTCFVLGKQCTNKTKIIAEKTNGVHNSESNSVVTVPLQDHKGFHCKIKHVAQND